MFKSSPIPHRIFVILLAGLALSACHRRHRDAGAVETVLPITSNAPEEPRPAREPPPAPPVEGSNAYAGPAAAPAPDAAATTPAPAQTQPPKPAKPATPPTDGAFGPDYSTPAAPGGSAHSPQR